MCGITGGVWNDPDKALDRATLDRMVAVLEHRGPDDEGTYCAAQQRHVGRPDLPGVALGQRRLSIIDVAGGHQPLANEDGTVWVVFNGEIYNFESLRRRLEGAGHRFRTRSDTETIVHLYEQEGADFPTFLNGMFAIAVWDASAGRLVLARDRLGQKPLVYRHEAGRLLFASQLKSLVEVPGVPRDLDPAALDAYLLYQYVPPPRTIFRGMHKLPPAHVALYENGELQIRRYWSPPREVDTGLTHDNAVEQLRELSRSAVRMRLQSEVPLGAFLSGGVDSTIIVGLMQQLVDAPVQTFSVGFPVPEYDETRFAREAAEYHRTQHREFLVEPDATGVVDQLVWHYDEPFADSSAIPTWYVSQHTRQHVSVALSGDGGDELFAGYPRYRAVWLAAQCDRLPGPVARVLRWRLWQRLPSDARQKSFARRFKRLLQGLSLSPAQRYLDWIAIFNEAQRVELYTESFLEQLSDDDPGEFVEDALAQWAAYDAVGTASLADLITYLPGDLMTKVDVASMAHGLECRQPMLDHRVVELAARMPTALKFRRGRGKRILHEAFADLLPPSIRKRPKMGFGVPLDHWLRGPLQAWGEGILFDPRTLQRGQFQEATLRRLWEAHQTGRFDHAYRLWSLIVLERWQRRWLD